MGIKPGQVVDSFLLGGKKVVLRYPKLSDAKKLQKFINQVIVESLEVDGRLGRIKKVSLQEEKKWVKDVIGKMKSGNKLNVLAELDGDIIGSVEIRRDENESCWHVCVYGVAVLEKYTGKGLGTKLTETIIKLAKKELKTEIIKLSVFGNNNRAQGLYKKVGFRQVGKIKKGKKVNGKYEDEVLMVKYL